MTTSSRLPTDFYMKNDHFITFSNIIQGQTLWKLQKSTPFSALNRFPFLAILLLTINTYTGGNLYD